MNRMLPVIALFVVSCAKPTTAKPATSDPATTYVTSSELEYYFDKFENDIGVNIGDVGAEFITIPAPRVGQCLRYDSGARTVQIDTAFWATATPDTKEQLMYHELGHCALELGHNSGVDVNGCPDSIMYPNAFGFSDCYANNKQAYYAELRAMR